MHLPLQISLSYTTLLRIRFEDGVVLVYEIDAEEMQDQTAEDEIRKRPIGGFCQRGYEG